MNKDRPRRAMLSHREPPAYEAIDQEEKRENRLGVTVRQILATMPCVDERVMQFVG